MRRPAEAFSSLAWKACMRLHHRLQLHSFAAGRQLVWRLVTAALLLAALAQPGLAPVQAAPAPRSPGIVVAPRPAPPCLLLVSNNHDTGAGSLRQAVACATAGQTVTFSNTLASATITLSSQISITTPLDINGSAAPGVKVDGANSSRIFSIAAGGPVTLTALVLQHGAASGGGGAVLADAASPLRLNQVDVLSSTATTLGGGLYAIAAVTLNGGRFQGNSCPSVDCYGGGLRTDSTLTLTDTQFISNSSYWDGGGAYAVGAVTLNGGRFQSNSCTNDGCYGAALTADTTVALTGTQFLTNTSRFNGGAVYAGGSTLTNALFLGNRCTQDGCDGGAYYVWEPTVITGTDFISNSSRYHGGGLDSQEAITITGGSFQRNLCNYLDCYGGGVHTTGALVVTGTQFISNTSEEDGGGAHADGPMVVTNALFQGNRCVKLSCFGGGLTAGSTLTLTASSFISNTADEFGGGIFGYELMRVTGSTFTGNTCVHGSCEGAGLSSQGPGLVFSSTFNGNHSSGFGGGLSGRSTLTVVNTTISGNTAEAGGGGIFAYDLSTVRLLNVTVVSNTSTVEGAGLYANLLATVSITNTLFAYNGALTCSGPIGAGSHNLEWPGATCATAGPTAGFTSADALLAPLALNAPGLTWTHALLNDSPARDAGLAATCAGPEVNNLDQRGVTRPIDSDTVPGAICDIGAFEASAPVFNLFLALVRR
jgi:predicted outer membrane repeat protein